MGSRSGEVYKKKHLCTGCGACVQICNYGALSMVLDEEGHLYPKKDTEACVDCGACYRVCHMLQTMQPKSTDPDFFAACSNNSQELMQASSGGIFFILARYIISQGGIVYGVVQPSLFDVHHTRAETLEQCIPMCRSKYLESRLGDIYSQVRRDLKTGKKVLFTGVGCQIAGLYSYLQQKDYPNLITCEMVCHGIPSISVFKSYIHEVESQLKKKVESINYRDKSKGWNKNSLRLLFTDGTSQVGLSGENPMHRGYLSGYYYRPSCAQCRYARLPRAADITLADFWKYNGPLLDTHSNSGISLVVCSSSVGLECFKAVKKCMSWEPSKPVDAFNSCHHLSHHPDVSPLRKLFFRLLRKRGFHAAYKMCRNIDTHSNRYVKRFLKLLKIFKIG